MAMLPSHFLKNKVEQKIKCCGQQYTFKRFGQNGYHGESEESTDIMLNGIYHESNGYITVTTTDGSSTRSKKSPMILCLFEFGKDIMQNDKLTIGNKNYTVTGVLDVQNFGVVSDISLEEVV